jgi:adenosylcobinamide-GDP ribazoletransferase
MALALVLLTRLPLPHLPSAAFARQAQSAWAFPLAGLAVAAPACLVGGLALSAGLPATIAAGLVLTVQIFLTGAMHEDGLADVADGFWGGFTRERRLEIMKDSRIGTYGVLALVLSIGLRWAALSSLLALDGAFALIMAIALLSRAAMPLLMATLRNARGSGLSSQVGRPGGIQVATACGLSAFAALILTGFATMLVCALALGLTTAALGILARRKIGGQTGDVLGCCQQICEISGLLVGLVVLAP